MTPVDHGGVTHTVTNGFAGAMPLPVARTEVSDGHVELTAWVPTAAERDMLREAGAVVTLIVHVQPNGGRSYSLKVQRATRIREH